MILLIFRTLQNFTFKFKLHLSFYDEIDSLIFLLHFLHDITAKIPLNLNNVYDCVKFFDISYRFTIRRDRKGSL